jgi:hypothetical protein
MGRAEGRVVPIIPLVRPQMHGPFVRKMLGEFARKCAASPNGA